MAKLKGVVQFAGQLDGLSFYEMDGKIIVRKTGGFNGKAIKTQDNYVRTRENASEFGHCAALGKEFRMALYPYLRKIKAPYMHNRVVSLFSQLMKCDVVSERGKRKVRLGMGTPEGKRLLQDFEFNPAVSLSNIVAVPYRVLMEEGKVVFDAFDVGLVVFPSGATHVSLQFLQLVFDFGSGAFVLQEGEKVRVGQHDVIDYLELTAQVTGGEGVVLGLVFAEFEQEMNGEWYGFEGRVMKVVGVG